MDVMFVCALFEFNTTDKSFFFPIILHVHSLLILSFSVQMARYQLRQNIEETLVCVCMCLCCVRKASKRQECDMIYMTKTMSLRKYPPCQRLRRPQKLVNCLPRRHNVHHRFMKAQKCFETDNQTITHWEPKVSLACFCFLSVNAGPSGSQSTARAA